MSEEAGQKIEADQISMTSFMEKVRFHYGRGKGHLLAYAWNRFRWHNYPRWRVVADFPLHVDVEISSLCNMRCPMCYTTTQLFKDRVRRTMMDFELFKKIIDECARRGLFSIRLSLRGEPFAHPRAVEMLRYAKRAGIQEVSTLTNALKLDEKMFEQLVDEGLDWLTISVDGWGETYEKIRRPAKWDDVYRKIRNFAEIKRRKGSLKPVVKVQSIWPAIQDDPDEFYRLFRPYADEVASNPLIDFLREDQEITTLDHFTCVYLWQRLSLGADGKILLCQCDDMEEMVLGDARKDSLHEAWHGEKLQAARRLHEEHKGHLTLKPCKVCTYPRKKETVGEARIGGRTVPVERYVGRDQQIGPKDKKESPA